MENVKVLRPLNPDEPIEPGIVEQKQLKINKKKSKDHELQITTNVNDSHSRN